MSRGKYGNRAALRRDSEEVLRHIDSLTRRAENAERELESLTARRAAEAEQYHQDIQQMAIRLAAATSPRVDELSATIDALRDENAALTAEGARIRETWEKVFRRVVNLLVNETGLTRHEALELMLHLVDERDATFLGEDRLRGLAPQQIEAIQIAKGHRKPHSKERIGSLFLASQSSGGESE